MAWRERLLSWACSWTPILWAKKREADPGRGYGRVEAVVDGDDAAIAAMLRWARHGPRMARVDDVGTRAATDAEAAMIGRGFEPLPDA